MEFMAIFAGKGRSECIGLFLAILELIHRKRVRADQDKPFGQIYVFLLDATPLRAEDMAESFGRSEAAESTEQPQTPQAHSTTPQEQPQAPDQAQTDSSEASETAEDTAAEVDRGRGSASQTPSDGLSSE